MTQDPPLQAEPVEPAAPEAHSGSQPPARNTLGKVLASTWLVVSVMAGLSCINGVRYETYGGDAYTGMQNAVARGTQGIGFLIIGVGVLAVVTAFRKV